MKRMPYARALLQAAGRCNIDEPRTPYAAAKEAQQRGIEQYTRGEHRYISRTVNGESLPITVTTPKWPIDGRRTSLTLGEQRDADFTRLVARARS